MEESKVPDLFDSISYSKGAMIIRMIRDFVNKRVSSNEEKDADYFFSRIKYHLDKFKYSNADSNDLMRSLEGSHSDLKLVAFLQGWIGNVGHPLVQVSWNEPSVIVIDDGTNDDFLSKFSDFKWTTSSSSNLLGSKVQFSVVNASQARYLAIPYDRKKHEDAVAAISSLGEIFPLDRDDINRLWSVPLSIDCFTSTSNDADDDDDYDDDDVVIKLIDSQNVVMDSKNLVFTFEESKCNYIRVNAESTGFYRVLYPREWYSVTSKLISRELSSGTSSASYFGVNDRSMFVHQVFGYFLDGRLDPAACLDALQFLALEDDYNVWKVTLGSLSRIRSRYPNKSSLKSFDKSVRTLIEPIVKRILNRMLIGKKTAGLLEHTEILLRSMILEAGVSYGVDECVSYFQSLWARFKHKKTGTQVESYEESAMYLAAVKFMGDFDDILDMYKEASVSQVKVQLLRALARVSATSNSKAFEKLLSYTTANYGDDDGDTAVVRTQDLYILLTGLCHDNAVKVTQFLLHGKSKNADTTTSDFFKDNYLDRAGSIALDRIVGSCMRFGVSPSAIKEASRKSSSRSAKTSSLSVSWISFWKQYQSHANFEGLKRTIMMINEKLQ